MCEKGAVDTITAKAPPCRNFARRALVSCLPADALFLHLWYCRHSLKGLEQRAG